MPDLRDADLHLSVLSPRTTGGRDAGPDGYDMDLVNPGDITGERVGMRFGGTDGHLRRAVANWQPDEQGAVFAWVKRNSTGTIDTIFASNDEATNLYQFILQFTAANTLQGGTKTVGWNLVTGGTTITSGQWYRVVFVSTGAAWLLYVNGQVETLTVTGVNNGNWLAGVVNRDNICIGGSQVDVFQNPYDGQITDARYISRVPTQAEITADYEAGVPDDDLRLWVPGRKFGNRIDYSRYNRQLVPQANTGLGKHIELDGVADHLYESVPDLWSGDDRGAVMAWVNPTNVAQGIVVFFSSDDEGSFSYRLWLGMDNADLFIRQKNNDVDDTVRAIGVMAAGTWQHVAVVSAGTQWILYRNGIAQTLSVTSGANTGDWFADTTLRDNIAIGARVETTVGAFFNGQLDDMKVLSRVPSADEILRYYRQTRKFF